METCTRSTFSTRRGLVVVDWTGAIVADPCFDLAFTELLLANPPLILPRPLAPVGTAAGRLLADASSPPTPAPTPLSPWTAWNGSGPCIAPGS